MPRNQLKYLWIQKICKCYNSQNNYTICEVVTKNSGSDHFLALADSQAAVLALCFSRNSKPSGQYLVFGRGENWTGRLVSSLKACLNGGPFVGTGSSYSSQSPPHCFQWFLSEQQKWQTELKSWDFSPKRLPAIINKPWVPLLFMSARSKWKPPWT